MIHDIYRFISLCWRCLSDHRRSQSTKVIHIGIILLFLLPLKTLAQETSKHDPLLDIRTGGYPVFAQSAEILNITDSVQGPSDQIISQRIFDLTSSLQISESTPHLTDPGSDGISDDLWSDCVAGDFDGDGIDEILSGWVAPDGILHLELSKATRLKPSYEWEWSQRALLSSTWICTGPIRLLAVNLDSTSREEFVVCTPTGSDVKVMPYYLEDQGQNVVPGTAAMFESGSPYDITAGDFNGDGRDELVQIYFGEVDQHTREISLIRIEYDPSEKTFKSGGGQGWPISNDLWPSWQRPKLTTGDFRNLGYDEAVFSYTLTSGNSGRQVFWYAYLLSKGGFMGLGGPFPGASPAGWTWGNGWESDAVATDLNPEANDGEELIVAGPGEVAVLKFNVTTDSYGNVSYIPYYCGSGNAKIPFLYPGSLESVARKHFLAVEDMDADTSNTAWNKEIIVAEHKQDSSTVIRVLSPNINENNVITGLSEKTVYTSNLKSRRSEIAAGDFDGDAIRLGSPTLVTKHSVYQPIVELNVPPTHFDYLNDQIYDVCNAYGTQPSEFKVTYTETQSQSSYFSSEVEQGWGLSGELSGGTSMFGVKVKAYVKASYDEGYYGSHSENTTVTASQVTTSTGDNWILATVTDYDFWEYPLYAMGRRFANVLVQIPHFQGTQWFPSRNVNARNWMATHEVGNLFSYLSKKDIEASTGTKLLTSFTGKYISIASSGSWTLDLANQNIDSKQLTNSIGAEVGASVSAWGIEASVTGTYSKEEIITHSSTATKDVEIKVEVSATDQTFGDTDYLVTPYMYWGENGAMVIDYAVDPSTTGQPDLGTFWDKNYLLHSDPGLILPWRLDSLKGIGGTEDIKLYCKSLHVSPIVPTAGDTAHITANIHNFSLKNTAGPVSVRFYLGNPASGGTPIEGITGLTDLSTNGPIPAQNSAAVKLDFVVPPGLSSTARVYAAIDPENTITEIHEENNIGFVPLRVQNATSIEEKSVHLLPETYTLKQNYPNPANPSTTIEFTLPRHEYTTLKIYNILGAEVGTLIAEQLVAGSHRCTFDGTRLASGVYYYQITAGEFRDVKKLILLR
jgi:hypothetical protein